MTVRDDSLRGFSGIVVVWMIYLGQKNKLIFFVNR
jgi:hypothetical protein